MPMITTCQGKEWEREGERAKVAMNTSIFSLGPMWKAKDENKRKKEWKRQSVSEFEYKGKEYLF